MFLSNDPSCQCPIVTVFILRRRQEHRTAGSFLLAFDLLSPFSETPALEEHVSGAILQLVHWHCLALTAPLSLGPGDFLLPFFCNHKTPEALS